MSFLDNSLLTVMLTLSATFLGLSIAVQVIQELYKYLRSSKGRAYQNALQDFLGPLALKLMRPGVLPDVRARGPFQMKRIRPKGIILPLERDELVSALERTAPQWVLRTLKHLKLEVEYQSSKSISPSPSWEGFLNELGSAEQGTSGYWNALEIAEFLKLWKHTRDQDTSSASSKIIRIGKITPPKKEFDAKQILLAFRKRFLPDVENAAEKFSQLENNFEYTYSRSNRRLTFVISLVLVFCFNLPIDVLYKKALETDPDSAIKLATTTLGYYNELEKANSLNSNDPLFQKNLELAKQTMRTTLVEESKKQNVKYLIDEKFIKELFTDYLLFFRYLFGCILTAIMISFGAPFWNDIASALFRMQKGRGFKKKSISPEVNNG